MTLGEIFSTIFINTISGVITQAPLFILIIWSVKTIVKQMPTWIEEYWVLKKRHDLLIWAKKEVKQY